MLSKPLPAPRAAQAVLLAAGLPEPHAFLSAADQVVGCLVLARKYRKRGDAKASVLAQRRDTVLESWAFKLSAHCPFDSLSPGICMPQRVKNVLTRAVQNTEDSGEAVPGITDARPGCRISASSKRSSQSLISSFQRQAESRQEGRRASSLQKHLHTQKPGAPRPWLRSLNNGQRHRAGLPEQHPNPRAAFQQQLGGLLRNGPETQQNAMEMPSKR